MNSDVNNSQNSNQTVVPNMTPNVNSNPVVVPINQNVNNALDNQVVNPTPVQIKIEDNPQSVVNSNVQNSAVINNVGSNVNNANTTIPTNTMNEKINAFIKGLFNFSNVKRLFSYDWSNIIDETLPKDSKESIDKRSYDNIFYGGALKIIADLLAIIFLICMISVIDTINPTSIRSLKTWGLSNEIGFTAFVPIIITLIVFTYNSAIGYKPQKTMVHFAFIWLIFLSSIFSIVKVITYIATLFLSPLCALLGFVSLFLSLLGNVHVMVGCIDFCRRVTRNYVVAHTVTPVQSAITTTRIGVDDVSDHSSKICPHCANKISPTATTCSFCGNELI